MMQMMDIPVEIATPATGMARALFHELADQLQQFELQGTTHTLDLFSLPLNQTDKQELEQLLGKGEIVIIDFRGS